MPTQHSRLKISLLGLLLAASGPFQGAVFAQSPNGLVTLDTVAKYPALLEGGATWAPGHSGAAGDTAIDLGLGSGLLWVTNTPFLNAAGASNTFTISWWQKRYNIANSSALWAVSTTAGRGINVHAPWSDNTIYYDTAGCCSAGTQRINANINTFAGWTGNNSFWNSWHHFAITFDGNQGDKAIFIDGQLFLDQSQTAAYAGNPPNALPSDFTDLYIGAAGNAGNAGLNDLQQGLMDDFAVFTAVLSTNDITKLFTGTAPSALPASDGLVAYWPFNDPPASIFIGTLTPLPNAAAADPTLIQITHLDGLNTNIWTTNLVALQLDGAAVSATVTKTNGTLTATYVPSPALTALSWHSATLLYNSAVVTNWHFHVAPPNTKDLVKGYVGALTGGAIFAPGRTGKAGDYAIDMGHQAAGPSVHILDASFLNVAGSNNTLAVSGWQKLYNIQNSAFFWGVSPSSNGSQRGWGTHAPWSNDTLYFDTAGCCDGSAQRINANINTFGGWADDTFWTNWHHFVFQYNNTDKTIWIDGQLFLEGSSSNPLPTDFTTAYIGYETADNVSMAGLVDDFSIYATALDQATIGQLFSGTLPTALPASAKLLAYWNFDDVPTGGLIIAQNPTPYTTSAAPNYVSLVHLEGATPWATNKLSLQVDGATVSANITQAGGQTTISFVPATLFPALSSHTATVLYTDASGTQQSVAWTFTVGPYTVDKVNSYLGIFTGGSHFTPDGGGHTGKAGDRAADIGLGLGPVWVSPVPFMNTVGASNEMTISLWQKRYDENNSTTFWAHAAAYNPANTGSNPGRGVNVHSPWSNDNIYYDTSGCCDGSAQRINADVHTFAAFTDDTWWTNWHHFAYTYDGANGGDKQIWIDGQLFFEGTSSTPLATSFTDLYIGSAGSDGGTTGTAAINGTMHGQLDDFAVFAAALSAGDIGKLATGTEPTALPASDHLVAYWPFDDAPTVTPPPPGGPKLTVTKSGSNVTLSWPTTAGFTLQSASSLTKPIAWTAVSTSPTTSGNTSSVTVPIGSGTQFFELKH